MIRWVGSLIYNVNVSKNNRKDADKLYPLPELIGTEKKKELKIPTKEEMAEMGALPFPRKLDDKTLEEVIRERKKGGSAPVPSTKEMGG